MPPQKRKSFRDHHNCETGELFQRQYLFASARLDQVKEKYSGSEGKSASPDLSLDDEIDKWKNFAQNTPHLAIWGAGAKGSTFLNLVDPEMRWVTGAVDVNPDKQGKHVGGSGHPIFSPNELSTRSVHNILVMNRIYIEEIRVMTPKGVNVFCID